MNNLIYIILDSCRHDTHTAAHTPNIDRVGRVEKRYSYASWTSPAHYVLLMGLTPHQNPPHVFASQVYQEDFLKWRERLNIPELAFKDFLPQLSLPRRLKELGYSTRARVSLPILNPHTTMSAYFDDYKLMDRHDDFAGMIDRIDFPPERPVFYFLNLGETHYPYMLKEVPTLHGVHGVFKHLDAPGDKSSDTPKLDLDPEIMEHFRHSQIKALEYVDGLLSGLFDKCPADTHFIITADHGELFGEDGFFGHGPIFHPKVFEVPFVEGRLPAR